MLKKTIFYTLFVMALLTGTVRANGLLIPTQKGIPPLSIKYQTVSIDIMTNVAKTKIVQEFFNNTGSRLEANYVFPLPEEASISDFAMYINGKRMSGELVEKDRAKAIYEDIVRKMKDPGLLEYMGNNLFRARVFPIEPHSTQKIELEYSQIVSFDNNVYSYVYPLKTGMQSTKTLEDFTISVNLQSKIPIKNIYSPTHDIGISRKDDCRAVIGFEKNAVYLDKDFQLYYTVSEEDIGINLFTYRKKGEDGYFMLMAVPKTDLKKGEVNKKNIVFTIDTSGSMAGEKIRNAINALTYCINNLNEQDSFNIIRFSTDVELFRDELVLADRKNIQAALDYVKIMRANGGTAIDYALTESLKMFKTPKGTNLLVFLTDGLPTIGERDIKTIISNAVSGNVNMSRIFSFGVGHDVNTVLLDTIAKDGRGMSEYLKSGEDIEITLSHFFNKVANPVLSDISLDFGDVKVNKFYPRAYPDIFKGDDLVIIGRYEGKGPTAIRLNGMLNDKQREYVFEDTFADNDTRYDFIPRLWAVRRVGYLLEEIKIHGEERELKDEVVSLSKEYGIMTPYTSYLVLENEQSYAKHGIQRNQEVVSSTPKTHSKVSPPSFYIPHKSMPATKSSGSLRLGNGGSVNALRIMEDKESRSNDLSAAPPPETEPVPIPADTLPEAPQSVVDSGSDERIPQSARAPSGSKAGYKANEGFYEEEAQRVLKAESGAEAVRMSKEIRDMKEKTKLDDSDMIASSTKVIKDRTFQFADGYWTQNEVLREMNKKSGLESLKIKYLSEAYFNLLKAYPGIKDYISIGSRIKLIINGKLLIIDTDGEDKMETEKIKEFFK